MNRDLKLLLAQAFGLGSDAGIDALIAKLRAGDAVDEKLLRKGCLALIDNAQRAPAIHAISDERLKIALKASDVGLWDWDLTTDNLFVDRTYFGFLGIEKDDQVIPLKDLVTLVHPEDLEDLQRGYP